MKSNIVYPLGQDGNSFLGRLRYYNKEFNLGYHIIDMGDGDTSIESAMLEGKVTLGVICNSKLTVHRSFDVESLRGLFRRKIAPLITIADAYPTTVSEEDLRRSKEDIEI